MISNNASAQRDTPIYPLSSLCEDEFFDLRIAALASETISMVALVTRYYRFVRDAQIAEGADIGAVFAAL